MPNRRAGAVMVSVAVVVALLAGCAGIPTSGRVVEAAPVPAQEQPPYVRLRGQDPQPGQDEVGIVRGFLVAMASYAPGYETARKYLAPDAKNEWNPSEQTTVFDGSRGFGLTRIAEGVVRMSVPSVGVVGSDGSYSRAKVGERVEFDLRLQPVDNEWRLVNPPRGVLMSEQQFDQEFQSFNLYFFDPQFQVLVPDPVYLPLRGSLSTLLAEALLRGPSRWLAPAVTTAVPPGTRLVLRSVPIVSGTAEVDLSSHALAATQQQRDQMMAQLAWTLRQVPNILRVSVDVGGVSLVDSTASDITRSAREYRQYDADVLSAEAPVYAIREGVVVGVAGNQTEPVGGPFGTGRVLTRSVAVDVRTTRAAVVDQSGTKLFVSRFESDAEFEQVATGSDLAAPTWDRTGLLWLADRAANGSSLTTIDSDGVPHPVSLAELGGQRVESFSLSLDGTRIVMLVSAGGKSRVLLGLVLRYRDRAPVVSSLREVPLSLGSIVDVGWSQATQLAVLGAPTGDPPQVFIVELNGSSSAARGLVGDAVSLAAAPNQQLVVATRQGQLLRQDAALRWNPVGEGSSPSYPG